MKWLKKVAATPLTTIAKVIDSLAEIQNERTNAPSIHATRAGINAVSAALDDAQAQINEEINDVKSDLDDTNTELGGVSDGLTALTVALNEVWKTIYPVGSIYINANDVNPATLFGGTWEKIQDRFLLASSRQVTPAWKASLFTSGLPLPSGTKSSGSSTGKSFSGTGCTPHFSQWMSGMGVPQ